jgi:hypothetical protein
MKILVLFLLGSFAFAGPVAGPNLIGNEKSVQAYGTWEESHEGVGLFCVHVTNAVEVTKGHSEATCFVTEVQALAKNDPFTSINIFAVEKWDQHGLTAITSFYADKNGDETTASAPNAVKYTFRLVIDLDHHTVTKYVEGPSKTLGYHLK